MASNEEPVLSDELILEFEQQIKDEEAQKVNNLYILFFLKNSKSILMIKQVPLVCQDEPIVKLEEEYQDNEPFLKKIKVKI